MSETASRPPHPAATICVFRDSLDGVEILMVQRGATARVLAGAWVFPGGAVDERDEGPDARAACAGDVDYRRLQRRLLAKQTRAWEFNLAYFRNSASRFSLKAFTPSCDSAVS